jgi:hypothetical protein
LALFTVVWISFDQLENEDGMAFFLVPPKKGGCHATPTNIAADSGKRNSDRREGQCSDRRQRIGILFSDVIRFGHIGRVTIIRGGWF